MTDLSMALDSEARANLSETKLREYHEYKRKLVDEGHNWEEIETILRGWIWDEIEAADDSTVFR